MSGLVKVGLTGGIACGKSTVARRWAEIAGESAIFVDADQLAHEVLKPDSPEWAEVVGTFGKDILNPDQTVNRAKLGEIVFEDESMRLLLNRVVHPAVKVLWTEALASAEKNESIEVAVVSIPLLYEVGAEGQFDCVVSVGCSERTQVSRLSVNGQSESQVRARILAQWPVQMKLDRADFVIWNDGKLELLNQQADLVWAAIKEEHHAAIKN